MLSDSYPLFFRRLHIFAVALMVSVGFSILGNLALANQIRTEAELQALAATIGKLKARMSEEQGQEISLMADLEKLEKKAERVRAAHKNHLLDLENLKTSRMQLGKQHFDLGQKMQKFQQGLEQLLRSSYLLSRQDSIKLLLNNTSPSESSRALSMYRFVVQSRNNQLAEIRDLRAKIEITKKEIHQKQTRIDTRLLEIESSQVELHQVEAEKQITLSKIRSALHDSGQKIIAFEQRQFELKQLLSSLKKKSVVSKKQAELKTDHSETTQLNNAKTNNAKGDLVAGGFRHNKGKMPLPVAARIASSYGQIRPESGLVWEGLMFDSPESVAVSAIYSGQVVFSDWFRGYGQLLVIDHGDGYMSLYGHNQELQVKLGAVVQSGQKIALTGTTGGLDEPGLYFEIRHNGSPDDPLKWCRI